MKALQELPIIVVLLYQLYKENIKQELVEYIPSVIRSLTLKPLPEIMYVFEVVLYRMCLLINVNFYLILFQG